MTKREKMIKKNLMKGTRGKLCVCGCPEGCYCGCGGKMRCSCNGKCICGCT